ncbi:MAG: histidine phosphatase family protein [Marmoricola sp.]
MTDLFCAATLLVARHGDASYVETCFSDEGGWLSPEGRAQARALAARVADRKIARVWCSDTSRAAQTAEIVAAELGLTAGLAVVACKALREVDAGDLVGQPFEIDKLRAVTNAWFDGDLAAEFPGGESGADVVARYGSELNAIADEHRGESVLVIVHQTAAGITVPWLAENVSLSSGRGQLLGNGEYVEMRVDADGWRVVGWSG